MRSGRTESKLVSRLTFDAHMDAQNAARIELGSYRTFLEQQGCHVPTAASTGALSSQIRSPSLLFQQLSSKHVRNDPLGASISTQDPQARPTSNSSQPEHHTRDLEMAEVDDNKDNGPDSGSRSEESFGSDGGKSIVVPRNSPLF